MSHYNLKKKIIFGWFWHSWSYCNKSYYRFTLNYSKWGEPMPSMYNPKKEKKKKKVLLSHYFLLPCITDFQHYIHAYITFFMFCSWWVSEKNTENTERLGRQARLGNEPDTSHLPVLSAEPLIHLQRCQPSRIVFSSN